MSPSISVCICTYNRAQSLRRTLNSFIAQNGINAGIVELLIVNNNCTDNTDEVIEAFREKLPIRKVAESRQGLAHARNKAVTEFRGEVLLFTDDDVRLATGWLAAYQDAIARFPEADFFGGRILPDWDPVKPQWIGNEPLPLIDGALVWFDHGAESRLLRPSEQPPFGASFAIRRRLFEQIGLFRVDLGTGGTALGRGEETEYLSRARDGGAQGVYVGGSLCFHTYDPRRLTLVALYRYGILSGQSHNAATAGPNCGSYHAAAWFVLRGLYQAARGRGDRFRQCIVNAGMQVGTRPGYDKGTTER